MLSTLITPIGTDANAAVLLNELDKHAINTSFIPRPSPSDMPISSPTAYVPRTLTEEYTIAFKNEVDLPLRAGFLRSSGVAGHIAGSDIVFLTFEVSQEAIHQVVSDLMKSSAGCLLVVTASPPREDLRIDRTILSRIDLLVGSDSEIQRLSYRNATLDLPTVVQRLINDGVRSVVALSPEEILAASRGTPLMRVQYPEFTNYDVSGARSAFTVCLAHQLRINAAKMRLHDLQLASVAYGLAANRFGDSEAMPTIDEILTEARYLGIIEEPA